MSVRYEHKAQQTMPSLPASKVVGTLGVGEGTVSVMPEDVWINSGLLDDDTIQALPDEDYVRLFKACIHGETNIFSPYVRFTEPEIETDDPA